MGWSHIPDIDSTSSNAEDNPFTVPKQQPAGKISVNLPTDDWLYRKMNKLNLALVQGYPSKSSEAGGLQRDHFIALIHPIQWTLCRCRPARQTSEKDVLCFHRLAGP